MVTSTSEPYRPIGNELFYPSSKKTQCAARLNRLNELRHVLYTNVEPTKIATPQKKQKQSKAKTKAKKEVIISPSQNAKPWVPAVTPSSHVPVVAHPLQRPPPAVDPQNAVYEDTVELTFVPAPNFVAERRASQFNTYMA